MPRIVGRKSKQPAKMPIGRLTPDKSTRYQMRIYGPTGPYDRSYGSPEMRLQWKEKYKAKGIRTRLI